VPQDSGSGGRGVDARLNRSFDPTSFIARDDGGVAGGRQGSAPDVRQQQQRGGAGANMTVQFNTAAQAIDV